MNELAMDFSVPGLLFPAISLLFLSFTNRFISYASLVRGLHDQWRTNCDSAISQQIENLRQRMQLIRITQIAGALSLLMCTLCMVFLLVAFQPGAWVAFAAALLCMGIALLVLVFEVGQSMHAIELQLDDMQSRETLQDCSEPDLHGKQGI